MRLLVLGATAAEGTKRTKTTDPFFNDDPHEADFEKRTVFKPYLAQKIVP
jgi:hypothetical protein